MSLGSNIYDLRAKADLSQEELAAKLGVSRQSVSKWETDASVPDVDKLIQLSKVFEVTLDELVNGEAPPQQQADIPIQEATKVENIVAVKSPQLRTRKIVGAVLIGVSLLAAFLSLIFPNDLIGIVLYFSLYFLLCGLLCLSVKKRLFLAIMLLTAIYIIFAILLIFMLVPGGTDISFTIPDPVIQ